MKGGYFQRRGWYAKAVNQDSWILHGFTGKIIYKSVRVFLIGWSLEGLYCTVYKAG